MGMFDDLESEPESAKKRVAQDGGMFDDLEDEGNPLQKTMAAPIPSPVKNKTATEKYREEGGGFIKSLEKGLMSLMALTAPAGAVQTQGAAALPALIGDKRSKEIVADIGLPQRSLEKSLQQHNAMPKNPLGGNIAAAYEANSGIDAPLAAAKELVTNPRLAGEYLTEMLVPAIFGGGAGGGAAKLTADAAVKRLAPGLVKKLAPRAAAGAGANSGATFTGGLVPNTAAAYEENGGDLAKAIATGLKQTSVESAVAAPFGTVLPFGRGVKVNAGKALAVSPVDEVAQTVAGNASIGKDTSGGEMIASALLGTASSPVDIATALWAAKQGEGATQEPTATPQDLPPEATTTRPQPANNKPIQPARDEPVPQTANERSGMFDDIEADMTADPILPNAPEAPAQEQPAQTSAPEIMPAPDPVESIIEEQDIPVEQSAADPTEQTQATPDVSREISQTQQPVETDGVRPLIENLIRRRRIANEMGKARILDNALSLGRDLLAGKPVKPAKFKNAAKAFEKDKPLFADLMALHELAKSPRPQNLEETPKAPRAKKSQLTTTDPDLYSEAARRAFLQILKKNGGISVDDAADITGESAVRTARMSPGLFKRGAPGIDLVARRLWETGYLTDEEYNDVDGGVQRARDLVGMALNKEPVLSMEQQERLAELERMAEEQAQAESEAEVIDALDLTQAEFESLFDGLPMDDQVNAQNLDQQRNYENDSRSLAESERNSGEIPAGETTADTQSSQGSQGRAGVQGSVPEGQQQNGVTGRNESVQRPDEADFTLERQTERELAEREAALAKREAEQNARERAALEKEKADRARDDFTLTGSDRAADANARQGDLLSNTINPEKIDSSAATTKPAAESKDPWNMTFDEYRQRVKSLWGESVTDDAETTQELRLQHLDFIETAIEEGKTVSAEALTGHAIDAKDYPLAAKMQGKETPATLPKGKAKASQQNKSIDNFGETLPPARRAMAAKLDESLSDSDIAARPLSEIWPQSENEAIEDTFAAAVAHAARAEIPAKPRVSYKVTRWVKTVQELRELAGRIVSGRFTRDEFLNKAGTYSLRDWISKVKLLEQLPRDQWKRVETVEERPDSYMYKDGAQVPTPMLRMVIDGKNHYLRNNGTVAGNMDEITALLAEAAPEKRMEFEIRHPPGGKFFINKKGDGQYRRLMEFDSVEEARNAIKNQYETLVGEWENVKARDNITERDLRSAENRPRVGKDHRGGRDVTPEEFQSAFGFRGGEFGKWVQHGKGDKERQAILNSAFDALHDLADIVGVPPRAISLNGTLGIAFGSRGSGWASAHFEPSNLVINLTKTRGAGALAHEWFHALDNYFSRMRGGEVSAGSANAYRDNNYITHKPEPLMVRKDGRPYERLTLGKLKAMHEARKHQTDIYNPDHWKRDPNHREGVRPEVEQRFAALVEALNDSPMTKRARLLDGKKNGEGYWSSTLERAARTFENYVQARMLEDGYHNDFLANVRTAEETGKNDARYPYLLPGEIKPISEAFGALFGELKIKETESGVAIFKRSDDAAIPESEWLSEAAIAQVVEERLAQFSHQPPVLIRDSEADVGTVSDAVASGMVRGGKIYLFRDGMADTAEVTRTLWHELLHYGLRRFLTREQYIASMKRLYNNDAWIKARADAWLAQSGDDTKQAQAKGGDYALARGVDEALAELGESNAGEFSNNSLKARALRTVARWIAMLADRFGFKAAAAQWRGITNDDARELVKAIFGKLRDDAPATSDDWSFTADSTYSRRVPSGPNSPQQQVRFSSPPGFKFEPETAIEGVQRKHQDSMNRWAKVQRQIEEQGGTVGLDKDVYHAMERMSGRAADRIDQFTHATIKPLLSRMTELKTGLDEIGTYLMALGAKDRNAYIQTIRQDMPDNGSGVSDAEAAQIIDDYKKRPDFAEFDQLARDFQQITDRKLKVLVGGGVITQQQAEKAQQDFGFYVPYKGFEKIDETGQRGNGTGLGYSTPSRASKRAFGRVSKAGQVVENIIRDYEAAIILAEKVNVGRYARALADANPDPALWTVDQPASQPVMTGGSVALMQAQFDAENEIRYIENGKAVRIQLHDPLLAQTYNNLGQEPLNTLLRAGDALNRVLRQTYTQKNPAFIFVNAMRDIQTGLAAITGEMGAASAIKSLKHAPGAWRAASAESLKRGSVTGEWAKYMAAYRKSGAAVAYYAIGDIEAKQTKLNELLAREGGLSLLDQWKQKGGGLAGAKASAKLAFWRTYNNAVVDVVEALNGGFENMMRLSAFRQYIDEHGGIDNVSRETLAEASRIAKNLTVNFNRKGEKTRAMNAAYLFWNANVQGSQNLYRIATKSIHNKQVKALMGGMVGLGFLMSMTTDDEDDELTPGYVKNTSIVLHIDGKRIQIPLAYGLGYFVAMGYEMGSLVKGRQTPIRTGLNMLSSALMHFSPLGTPIHDGKTDMKDLAVAATPTILKPIVMSATNRNGMGYEVVPKYDDDAPDRPAMRANTRGGVYDKAAGGLEATGLDVSPESIKMATTFISGGLGTFLADSVSASMAGSKGEFDPEKTPILKRFYGVNDVEEYRARFYDQTDDVQTQAREQGKKQKEFFGSNKSEDSVQDFRKVMMELREEEMEAYAKNNFKRAEALQDKQIRLATRFNVLHDRMIKNGRIEKR